MSNRAYLVVIGLLVGFIVFGAARGGSSPEDRALAVGSRIMCPVCQGSAISNSPSETATAMMDKVEELIEAGRSDGQILAYFSDRYGENIILDPAFRGRTMWVWLLPFVAFGAGVWMILRRRRRDIPVAEEVS